LVLTNRRLIAAGKAPVAIDRQLTFCWAKSNPTSKFYPL